MSLPEVLLWRELRGSPHGPKFRRQHPSGRFVLDFYCPDARLAIEIDGAQHGVAATIERDAERDDWFARHGIATLRIAAARVLADPTATVDAIFGTASARLPLHHPAAPDGPPPRAELGEDR